jgi:uncharacterized Zn finger protein
MSKKQTSSRTATTTSAYKKCPNCESTDLHEVAFTQSGQRVKGITCAACGYTISESIKPVDE